MSPRIRILQYNKRISFMFWMLILTSLFLITFGVLMWFSPSVLNQGNNSMKDTWKILQTIGYEAGPDNYGDVFVKSTAHNVWIVMPNETTIAFLPVAVGLFTIIIMLSFAFVQTVGFKAMDNKKMRHITAPIRLQQLTMIFAWLDLILIIFVGFMSYSASAIFFGQLPIQLNFALDGDYYNYAFSNGYADLKNYWNSSTSDVWWLTWNTIITVDYSKMGNQQMRDMTGFTKQMLYAMISAAPVVIMIILTLLGVTLGETAWGKVNIVVLANIGDNFALEALNKAREGANRIDAPQLALPLTSPSAGIIDEPVIENLSPKEAKKAEKMRAKALKKAEKSKKHLGKLDNKFDIDVMPQNASQKDKQTVFLRNIVKMMELSGNIDNNLYSKFKSTYDALIKGDVDNKIDNIQSGIDDFLTFATKTDKEFVQMVKRLLTNNKAVFGIYADDLGELINEYTEALDSWNVFDAEVAIEQIFAITINNDTLLAKVGYCIKYRLSNHFSYINHKMDGINKLNNAKIARNLVQYRQACIEAIEHMSPIKTQISKYASQILMA